MDNHKLAVIFDNRSDLHQVHQELRGYDTKVLGNILLIQNLTLEGISKACQTVKVVANSLGIPGVNYKFQG